MTYEKIWNKLLAPTETVEYVFSLSNRYINIYLFFWLVVGIAMSWIYGLGVGIFLIALFYYGYYLRAANAYAFTNRRILIHRGWLSTNMVTIDFSKITEVEVEQGFLEKLLYNSGKLLIDTAGTAPDKIVLFMISDPYGARQKLAELMDRDRQEMRTPV